MTLQLDFSAVSTSSSLAERPASVSGSPRTSRSTARTWTHGRITWSPGWSRNSNVDPAVAVTADCIAIKIQLLRGASYEPWPTQTRVIEQRYRDAPPAILRVPTVLAFAGWKTAAWLDRGAARDLHDLWALDRLAR